ncbi:MAG: prepilin-type N-terminal cleavage/methylation domain-containing protein [Candidatus Omnitrophica bacterium]|nr:prepilin-type N-terminal cleavage/methylation domain-containing protein [Candidatus Omnitrophota bacterium]
MKKGFTLLELIVVIVILGILATLGFTQYNKQVESTRLAEAKIAIGSMRQLATEYYWKNGSLTGIQNGDVGADNTCTSSSYFHYYLGSVYATGLYLMSARCTSGGKSPNVTREYIYRAFFKPDTGCQSFRCYYSDDTTTCFGISDPSCPGQ